MTNQYVPTASTLPIPTYTIDLALPPELRYVQLSRDFAPKMRTLTHLFDDIVASVTPYKFIQRAIKFLASFFLFRLYSTEQTREIKGIAEASGVPLHLVVALNVILDSLLGCTSGAVRAAVKSDAKAKADVADEDDGGRMVHFRTLDWGMDPLRDVLVVLEFVRSDSDEPAEVLARSITYAGFVGVLTGVRKELSLSLNFRPYHACSTRSLRTHQLAVLFGFRPSISSLLRDVILPQSNSLPKASLSDVTSKLESATTSPCYLILSTSAEAAVLEKDLNHARIMTSEEFIVATNCDCDPPSTENTTDLTATDHNAVGMDMILDEADQRKGIVEKRFKDVRKRQEKKWSEENGGDVSEFRVKVRDSTILGWLKVYPVWNELTHFGCLMDPKEGEIMWTGRGVLEEQDDKDDVEERAEERVGWRGV